MAGSFVQELKRRNVFRVALVYVVVSWLLMQIGDVMFPALRLPDWTTTLLVAFLILGFPLAVIFAWAFELTPDGVVRTALEKDPARRYRSAEDMAEDLRRVREGLPIREIARLWDEDATKLHHEYAKARKEFQAAVCCETE